MQALDSMELRAALETLGMVCLVLNRIGRDFSDRDRECLFRLSREIESARASWGVPAIPPCPCEAALTGREREVLRWLASGKTDKDIGCILGISHRTVHKHLQRLYEKLGVETRTAAVARWGTLRPT